MDDFREEDSALFEGRGGPESQTFPADEFVRNPYDEAAFPPDEDAPGDSFPSLFLPAGADSLTEASARHVFQDLQALVERCLETHTTPADAVSMVHEFYERKIRPAFEEAPPWSRRSIYAYIYRGHERQAEQAIASVNATIEFLRTQTAVKSEGGVVKVHAENVKLLLAATKVHASLVDAKRKRDANR